MSQSSANATKTDRPSGGPIPPQVFRSEGWLDWHILNAVASVATNYRMREPGLDRWLGSVGPPNDRQRAEMDRLAEGDADLPLEPVSEFDLSNLRLVLDIGLGTAAVHWDLEIRQLTPDFPALKHLLRERYGYFTDDIPHEDPFPPLDDSKLSTTD